MYNNLLNSVFSVYQATACARTWKQQKETHKIPTFVEHRQQGQEGYFMMCIV